MRALFTIHAGEYIVGERLESMGYKVWIPSKDTGIDLLVSDGALSSFYSLQVKFSRDYNNMYDNVPTFKNSRPLVSSWFKLDHDKLEDSTADYWVFVIMDDARRRVFHHIVIEPKELLRRLVSVYGDQKRYTAYFLVTDNGSVYDWRGLQAKANHTAVHTDRDYTQYLDAWP